MQHNDHNGTGWNPQETVLNTTNVQPGAFGLRYTMSVDGAIYSQPLVVTGVTIGGVSKNVVYITTVNNTIFAYNTDDGTFIWSKNFTPPGFRPPTKDDMHPNLCNGRYWDFADKFGIVGTPVINKTTNTLYFVNKVAANSGIDNHPFDGNERSYTSTGFHQYLHAIDLSTGNEKPNSPVEIAASAPGTGNGSVGGMVSFDPRRNFNRTGLVMSQGIVYIAFAAHCDWGDSHGWVLGYDGNTLAQRLVYTTTPNDGLGGIWMSGGAPAVDDATGAIYFTSGNANGVTNQTDARGESVVKLIPNLATNTFTISSFFTPKNYATLNGLDLDFPIQVMLLPSTSIAFTGLKDGNLFLMDRSNLGGFDPNANHVLQTVSVGGGTGSQMHSSFAYFGGNTTKYIYQFSEATSLKAYPFNGSLLGSPIVSPVDGATSISGSMMSVSSNGGNPSSGILWASHMVNGCIIEGGVCPGILRAMKADDVTKELWNSNMVGTDNVGTFSKFVCPTIANGNVYMASNSGSLKVYGLIPGGDPCAGMLNVALHTNNPAATYQSITNDNVAIAANAFDGNLNTKWTTTSNDGDEDGTGNRLVRLIVNLGSKYDICKLGIHWGESSFGDLNVINYVLEGSNDGTNYTTLDNVSQDISVDHFTYVSGQSFQYIRLRCLNPRNHFQDGFSVAELEVFGTASNPCATPTNLAITNPTESTGTLSWSAVPTATSYNIQYRVNFVSSWRTATTTAPTVTKNLTALTCNTDYIYQVQAVCPSGNSAYATIAQTSHDCTTDPTCALPTRYKHADLGEIGIAGSSCQDPTTGVFTLKGSGSNIGGTSDEFQFAYIAINNSEMDLFGRITSQDGVNSANKIGIMMRDSISNTSKYVFIGRTSGNGFVFSYRNGYLQPATTVTLPSHPVPYWIRLKKIGTQYTAYTSADGLSWHQEATISLGFGTNSVYGGLAVTSANNSVLSTATIDNFNESSTPLPIKLTSFTASNYNNSYVLLKWSTSMEQFNDHFDIERSLDGTNFEKIGAVKAVGNSTTPQYYSTQDDNPADGMNFYRLKQVDLNGKTFYSWIVPVQFGKQIAPTIFPNPANSFFNVIAGKDLITEVVLYSASGNRIQHLLNKDGLSTIKMVSSNLAPGVYIVEIRTATQIYQQKLLKQ